MKTESPKHFWTWFQKFSETYLLINKLPHVDFLFWIREINDHLKTYCDESLVAVFEWNDAGFPAQLVISANGRPEYFHVVDRLVKHAPSLPGWQVHALLPPRRPDHKVNTAFNYTGIDPYELWFRPPIDNCPSLKVDIEVYAEIYNPEITGFEKVIELVLCNILGERSRGEDVGQVHIKWLYALPVESRSGLIKLQQLPAWLESWKQSGGQLKHTGEITIFRKTG